MTSRPRLPSGLGTAGRRLYAAVLDRFELEEHEAALLLEAARTRDLIAQLQGVVDAAGVVAEGKPHPVLVELRQQRLVLARLLAALRLPDDADERPQRRQVRGVYRGRTNPPNRSGPLGVVS
jgi:hypothetical protein